MFPLSPENYRDCRNNSYLTATTTCIPPDVSDSTSALSSRGGGSRLGTVYATGSGASTEQIEIELTDIQKPSEAMNTSVSTVIESDSTLSASASHLTSPGDGRERAHSGSGVSDSHDSSTLNTSAASHEDHIEDLEVVSLGGITLSSHTRLLSGSYMQKICRKVKQRIPIKGILTKHPLPAAGKSLAEKYSI